MLHRMSSHSPVFLSTTRPSLLSEVSQGSEVPVGDIYSMEVTSQDILNSVIDSEDMRSSGLSQLAAPTILELASTSSNPVTTGLDGFT